MKTYISKISSRRKHLWTYSLTAVDGAELNLKQWERNSAYYQAKRVVRQFLWVVVLFGLVVPLAVHNMRVGVPLGLLTVGVLQQPA